MSKLSNKYYIAFPARISKEEAEMFLDQWGAIQESDGQLLEGELCFSILASDDFPKLAKTLTGVSIYDNETHPELF